jgi:hypothetical protein
MANRQTFGRRAGPQSGPRNAPAKAEAVMRSEISVARISPPATETDAHSVDRELQEWKQARGSGFKFPWRQVSLMASLCFGLASFILPDWVSDKVDWLLWGLAAMSAYAWFAGRKKNPVKDSAAP